MKNAVVYARYSSEKQNDQSIEGQLRICQQYAKSNDLNIVDVYIDKAISGKTDNRPAFQKLLADSATNVSWDIVLIYAIDRFGRNSIEIAVNKQKLIKNHKTLISATQRTSENIDGTKNLDGILLENMYIGLAEYYSAELSQKVKRGIYESHKKGLFTGGAMLYGYKAVNKRITVCEEEASVVNYIFSEYLYGKSMPIIARELNQKGFRNKNKLFNEVSLNLILKNKKYIGIAELKDGIYTDMYPPIVSKNLFDRVQWAIQNNRGGVKSKYADYILRKLCVCGYCGKMFVGESGRSHNGSLYHYYKCAGRKKLKICNKTIMKKSEFENTIIHALIKLLSTPENVSLIADAVLKIHKEKSIKITTLDTLIAEKAEAQKALDNIMNAIEQGIITNTTKERIEKYEKKLSEINAEIAVEEYNEQNKLTKSDVVEFLTNSIQKSPRAMLKTLVQRIVVYNEKCEIYCNYTNKTPPLTSTDKNQEIIHINYDSSDKNRGGAP